MRPARSFASKVVLAVTLTAGLALAAVSTLLVAADHRDLRRSTQATLEAQAAMVALDSGAALVFGDREHAGEVLAALRTAPDLAAAALFDREGELFASYRRPSGAAPDPRVTDPGAPASGSAEEGRWHRLSIPVVDRGERQGQLLMIADLAPIRARLLRTSAFAATISAVAMFLAFLTARRIAAGLTVQTDELVRTANRVGETRDSTLRAAKLSDDELGGLAVAFNDMLAEIDEQKRELQQAQAGREELLASERAARSEAERASRLKDEFVATLSHELRTPLAPILGWVAILRQVAGDPKQLEKGLEVIERNARLQTRLIEDLLEMSRILSGKQRLDVQPVELVPVIEAALATVRPAAEAREIRLQTVLDGDTGPVHGDPNRLQQVVWNLLSNAIKFTPKGGRVQISLARVNSHVEIVVADNGQGIEPELLPFVFDRFRQGDSSTTRQQGGLGLGLAIARQLVELHGGSVRAESAGRDRGAVFTVVLPLMPLKVEAPDERREHPLTSRAGAAGDGLPTLGGVDVLVVDDDHDTRDLLQRVLALGGASVRLAGSAAEALHAHAGKPAEVLISDIGMPSMDGYELIRKVRELDRARSVLTPAIALTAFARTEDRTRALLAGYQMHIAKPVDPAELLAAVATLAGRT
jgi:signal transduction histidine kinase/CheY-like chemotaxis protein